MATSRVFLFRSSRREVVAYRATHGGTARPIPTQAPRWSTSRDYTHDVFACAQCHRTRTPETKKCPRQQTQKGAWLETRLSQFAARTGISRRRSEP
ncbi:unnamed protein product [Lampetra planeri]